MKKSFLLFVIFLIAIFSLASFFIILNYFDPYTNKTLALVFIIFSFSLMFSSFGTLLLYFIKKIYYRGEVELYHIKTSFRQSFFVSIFIIGIIFFINLGVSVLLLSFLLFIILLFLEIFFQD